MRSSRNYRAYTYARRRRALTERQWQFIAWVVLLACLLVAFRLDYITQRDCNGNQACLDAVM